MRLLLAGLFVFLGLLACFSFWTFVLPEKTPPVVISLLVCICMGFLVVGALIIFNWGRKPQRNSGGLEQLKARGMIESTLCEALRAFEVEEFEDEGAQFFVELQDGSVLFLRGQYLYDYLPADGKVEPKRLRRFPCTRFTLLRHKESRDILDVECSGEPIEPETEAPSFTTADFDADRVPEDGEFIRDKSYEHVKAENLRRKR